VSQSAEAPGVPPRARGVIAAFLVICALIFPFVLLLGVTKGLNHDEHQHIAAGVLVGHDGLLPYRDFPHFHTPYLAFVYALLFRTTDHLLLAARLFSVACATAMVGLVGSIAWSLFRARGQLVAIGVSAGAVLLCLSAGLFGLTTGRAWNQEPALLFTLLAFCAHVAGLRHQKGAWLVGSGILLGLAIGLRLTVAPLLAPFGLAIILFPAPHWNLRLILCFIAGTLIGTAGIMAFFVMAPEQTFFGNFGFAKVNVAYRLGNGGAPRTMTLIKKFRYVWKEIIRREVPLIAFSLLPLIALGLARRGPAWPRLRFEFWFILLLSPFILVGSLAPSPLFAQYFYPIVPFLLLAGLYALTALPPATRAFRNTLWAGAAVVVFSVALGHQAYRRIRELLSPPTWAPVVIHDRAAQLFAPVPRGRILTLAPIYPLEAGRSIYPALSTGPFAWRVADFVEPARAVRLGMISPATLQDYLRKAPPAAIMLERDPTPDSDFFDYVEEHGFHQVSSSAGGSVWVPP
jgi:multisubunit Na+/H+ antiporter MnhF subunit